MFQPAKVTCWRPVKILSAVVEFLPAKFQIKLLLKTFNFAYRSIYFFYPKSVGKGYNLRQLHLHTAERRLFILPQKRHRWIFQVKNKFLKDYQSFNKLQILLTNLHLFWWQYTFCTYFVFVSTLFLNKIYLNSRTQINESHHFPHLSNYWVWLIIKNVQILPVLHFIHHFILVMKCFKS